MLPRLGRTELNHTPATAGMRIGSHEKQTRVCVRVRHSYPGVGVRRVRLNVKLVHCSGKIEVCDDVVVIIDNC